MALTTTTPSRSDLLSDIGEALRRFSGKSLTPDETKIAESMLDAKDDVEVVVALIERRRMLRKLLAEVEALVRKQGCDFNSGDAGYVSREFETHGQAIAEDLANRIVEGKRSEPTTPEP